MKKIGLNQTLSSITTENIFIGIPSQPVDRMIESIIFSFAVHDNTDVNDRVLSCAVAIIDTELQNITDLLFNLFDPNLMIYSGQNGSVLWQHFASIAGADCGTHVELPTVNHFVPAGESRTILMPWIGKYKISTATGSINTTAVRSISTRGRDVQGDKNQSRYELR